MADWINFNKDVSGFGSALNQYGQGNLQRQQELQQVIALAQAKANLEQMMKKREFAQNLENYQRYQEMQNGGAQQMQQPQQIQQPNPEAAMSMPNGGVGNVQGQSINPFVNSQAPQTNRMPQDQSNSPFTLNPFTGAGERNPEYVSPNQKRLSKQNQITASTRIRQEFINRPEVKDYVVVSTNVKAMDSLLNKAKAGSIQDKVALDQGLITMYNKLTDPQSVVRESEFARTPENLPVVNRIYGALQKVNQGGAGLTDEDRQALVQGAKIIAEERGNTYNNTLQDYQQLANEYEIDPELITRGMPLHESSSLNASDSVATSQFQEGQTAVNPKTKQRIIFKGGQWQPAK